jgi:hypothetical protein
MSACLNVLEKTYYWSKGKRRIYSTYNRYQQRLRKRILVKRKEKNLLNIQPLPTALEKTYTGQKEREESTQHTTVTNSA